MKAEKIYTVAGLTMPRCIRAASPQKAKLAYAREVWGEIDGSAVNRKEARRHARMAKILAVKPVLNLPSTGH